MRTIRTITSLGSVLVLLVCGAACGDEDTTAGLHELGASACKDGKDNDNDGTVDCNDDDCAAYCTGKAENTAALCQDTKDNDEDGKTDCQDSDCKGYTFCASAENTSTACADKKDNDGDGKTDCDDDDCKGFTFCSGSTGETTPSACADKKDNDGDGKTDCDDDDCKGYYFCLKVENTAALCQDTKDNDGDGTVDCNDSDCAGFTFCDKKSESSVVQCKDTKDNDGDGKIDCDDTDCQGFTFCAKNEDTAALCQDKKDNDGDGYTDCADTDCKGFTFCVGTQEFTTTACKDGKDNDNDGKTDCDDSDCAGYYFCQKNEDTAALCQDKKDNDADGKIDCADTDCQGFYFCLKSESTTSQCQDGKDNDGDGKTDCDDTDCKGYYFCQKIENTAVLCQDTKDNDGDGKTDCDDTDCKGFYFCQKNENTASLCNDKKDNDGDGKVDCDDTDCQVFTFCAKTEMNPAQCTDKKDNDGDGKIDCDDSDCKGYYFCQKFENTATLCTDKKDNDGDGKIDCKDTDCQAFSFCQSGAYEATAAQCQDKSDNDGDGKTDCADQGCWHWYFCGHYSGFPVTDAWGATWDGQPRAATTWTKADQACKALGGRLPTATELYRNNTSSGGSTISGPQATEYLWTLISAYQTSYKVAVRLSNGGTTSYKESTSLQYRCVWPKANATKGFNAGHCHGTPGSTCTAHDGVWNIDSQDRPPLDYAAATNECAFYGGSIPSLTDWSEAIHEGLKNGTNNWMWTGKATYWYNKGHGMSTIRWSGTGTPNWYYYKSTWANVHYGYSYLRFRCIGLATPANFTKPTATCNGGCLTVDRRRSVMLIDKTERSSSDYKTAFANCRVLGGDMPNVADFTEAVHHKLPGGKNWIFLAEPMYWYSNGYGYPIAKFSGTGTEHWMYYGWGSQASDSWGYSKYYYRCIWRTMAKALPKCSSTQVIKVASGKATCVAQVKGTSAGKAQTEKIDQWSNAWDGVERGSYATYANAAQLCKLYGGRLPTSTELYRVRASGNPHKTIGTTSNSNYLWTTTPYYSNGNRIAMRVSDGKLTYYKESATRPYRCVWPATVSDVLYRGNCHGPPGKECFTSVGGMLADSYDRPPMDVVAASYECVQSGGHLPDNRELNRLIHQGLSNGSNNWLWLNEPIYWYSGHYGYALARWSGVGSTSWYFNRSTYGTNGYGYSSYRFRCVYSPYLR